MGAFLCHRSCKAVMAAQFEVLMLSTPTSILFTSYFEVGIC